ncbi:MAG: Holliday junction resolvase [Herbinix sp.]|nr:Holliday junction resolvase [Herbinix sp.]
MVTDKIRPTKKPDIDNIAKVILDALNGIAYKDDTQVVTLEVRKFYKDTPCVIVDIEEVGD